MVAHVYDISCDDGGIAEKLVFPTGPALATGLLLTTDLEVLFCTTALEHTQRSAEMYRLPSSFLFVYMTSVVGFRERMRKASVTCRSSNSLRVGQHCYQHVAASVLAIFPINLSYCHFLAPSSTCVVALPFKGGE